MQWHNGTWHNDMMDDGKFGDTMAQGTWLNGTMARWYNGTKAYWYNLMVQWYMAQWEDGSMARCLNGKYDGMIAQWYDVMVQWQVDGLYYVDFCCDIGCIYISV